MSLDYGFGTITTTTYSDHNRNALLTAKLLKQGYQSDNFVNIVYCAFNILYVFCLACYYTEGENLQTFVMI